MKKFKILKTGNFYFPIMDKNKEFIVENTIDLVLDKKYDRLIDSCLKSKNVYLKDLADPIWDALKKSKEKYKDCWLVPITLDKIRKEHICHVDILRKV